MANCKMVIEDNAGNGYLPAPGLPTKTAAQWSAENRVLLLGEMVQESDTKKIKIGDGVKPYTTLPETNIEIGFAQNLVRDSGYKKMPGGLIVQWGRLLSTNTVYSSTADAYRAKITFPIIFPTILPIVTLSPDYAGGIPVDGCGEVSRTDFCVYTKNPLAGHFVNWIAIGC